jgi:hypothetical protein
MNRAVQRIPTGVLVHIAVTIAIGAILATMALSLPGHQSPASASGGGCTDANVQGIGGDPVASHDAAPDIVTDVCIKAGTNMFDSGHSGKLDNGTFENGCYQVSGVGTSKVTVERIGDEGRACQRISHIDVYTGIATPTPTPTATATAPAGSTPTATATSTSTLAATPTSTPTGQVLGVTALPDTGQPPGGSPNWVLPLLALGGLLLLGGAGTVAVVKVRRRR